MVSRGSTGEDREVMYVRIADGDFVGMSKLDGYLDAQTRAPGQIAKLIEDRVQAIRR